MKNETMDDVAAEAPAAVPATKTVKAKKKKAAPKKKASAAPKKAMAKKAKAAPESKTAAVVAKLASKGGITRAEILAMTGWKAVSVQQVAKVAKLKLSTEKDGSVLRYFGRAK